MSTTTTVTTSGRLHAWWHRPEIHWVVAIWAAMTVALVIFSLNVPARLMGAPASPTMHSVEQTMTVFSVAASPVAAVVWAIGLYSLIAWRHKGPMPPEADGPGIRTDGPATMLWLVLSTVLAVFLLLWGLSEIPSVAASASAGKPLVVDVTGQQWVWTFSYPEEGGVQSDQLYLPLDRPVVFKVTSEDVIHSFWVVQMGIKVDANPGVTTTTSVTPNKLGVFNVRCAELCGLLHADMETSAHVVRTADFNSWVAANGGHP
jgi:cytochrome c oxidase subunit 2